jgi:DNA polymerase elongation subunit (family B)
MGNRILHKWVDDKGKRHTSFGHTEVELFIPTVKDKKSKYKDVSGIPLSKMEFSRIAEAKEFVKTYKGISNFPIHGNQNYWAQFISNQYPEIIEFDQDALTVANIDIEVKMGENGFPHAYLARSPVTAITVGIRGHYTVFGYGGKFENNDPDVTYISCKDEKQLLWTFIQYWQKNDPDVVTGWNTSTFDIPYLVNRISRVISEDASSYLAPAGRKASKHFAVQKKHRTEGKRVEYDLAGIAHLDYLQLYRKFTFKERERYSLDFIAYTELKKNKLDYSEYGNLDDLYEKNYQKYIEYNIRDVKLVDELDRKLNLMMLAMNLAYKSKIPLDSVFSQVRMWDSYIYNALKIDNVVVPQKKHFTKSEKYKGAVVFEPQIGIHDWVISFDLDGLYPHLIMQYGISPEVIINKSDLLKRRLIPADAEWVEVLLGYWDDYAGKLDIEVDMMVDGQHHDFLDAIKHLNYNMTSNGALFDGSRDPMLPKLMLALYNERKGVKQTQLKAESLAENLNNELTSDEVKYQKDIAKRCKVMQMGIKVFLNSAYGMIGNEYSRYYDVRIAEGITLSGQLSILWIRRKLNIYLNNMLDTGDHDYIIAGDTDSVYITLNEAVKRIKHDGTPEDIVSKLDIICEKSIQPYVTRSFQELATYMNAREQKMNMSREVIASKGLWRAKKNYALDVYNNEGVQYDEPKLKIMGMESVRSSTPEVCRKAFEDVTKLVLRGTEKDVQSYVTKFKKKHDSLDVDDICTPTGINDIDKWECDQGFLLHTPVHVKAAMTYNRWISEMGLQKKYRLIQNGDKIKWSYLKKSNPTFSNVIGFPDIMPPEFNLEEYIDVYKQYDKKFLSPINTLCYLAGWNSKKVGKLF